VTRALRKAEELVSVFGLKHPPVPVEEIAQRLGAQLVFEPYEGPDAISGMLYRRESTTIIGVNSAHPRPRQRFTIAHEIGHLLLHPGDMFLDGAYNFRDRSSGTGTHRREVEANVFASALLMPEAHVKAALDQLLSRNPYASSQEIAQEVARSFVVSRHAAELRLIGLGFIAVG
jgi:Zn-dependent peptidase ImmA (M78 family)